LTTRFKSDIIIIEIKKESELIKMAKKGMTPSKRHAMRAMYEAQAQERRNARLGLKPTKKSKRR
jgi:hypothetical protein